MRESRGTRQRFDPPNPPGRRTLGNQFEEPDLSRSRHMRSPAELERVGVPVGPDTAVRAAAHGNDPDFITILLAEERARTKCLGVVRAS